MPKTNRVYHYKQDAIKSFAKEINRLKSGLAGKQREKLEEILPELRKLWLAAKNGDDEVPLHKMVKILNTWKFYFGKEFRLMTRHTREHGKALELFAEPYI